MNKIIIVFFCLSISIIFYFINSIFLKKDEHFAGNKFSSSKLNIILEKISNILIKNDLNNWFIGYGTLLGIVRNNSCINNDDDIDIIIDYNDKNKINEIIKKYNFKIVKKANHIYKIELEKNLPTVDFYFSNIEENTYIDHWERVIWTNCKPIQKLKWKNTILNIPNEYQHKLLNRYGINWRIPQKNKGNQQYKKDKSKYQYL